LRSQLNSTLLYSTLLYCIVDHGIRCPRHCTRSLIHQSSLTSNRH
jgi:hypothetical protein